MVNSTEANREQIILMCNCVLPLCLAINMFTYFAIYRVLRSMFAMTITCGTTSTTMCMCAAFHPEIAVPSRSMSMTR